MLLVTSNPTRTSPVKRGLFVLENILGMPAPPAPAGVPDLEESAKKFAGREPTAAGAAGRPSRIGRCALRAMPAWTRWESPWRTSMPWACGAIEEKTAADRRLGQADHRRDVSRRSRAEEDPERAARERFLSLRDGEDADLRLGSRPGSDTDEHTVDLIVERLEGSGGKFSDLLHGVIESAPFQKQRNPAIDSWPRRTSNHEHGLTIEKSEQRALAMSRRHFLRGVGVSIALPALSSLPARSALAETTPKALAGRATTASGAPLRMAFMSIPNGVQQDHWFPTDDFQLNASMAPLEPLKEHFQVIGGLDHENATAGRDGAGDHARASATFLTGARARKTAGSDIHVGISVDQVAAQRLGHLTRFPSLELSSDVVRNSGSCDSGYACAYQYNLAWSSATTPVTPEPNPRLVFERLFGAGEQGERQKNFAIRQETERSILDFVLEETGDVQRRLGAHDRRKFDEYLTGVREMEQRLKAAERFKDLPGRRCPDARRDSGRLRRVHAAHVRHAGPGVPDRLDADRHAAVGLRRQQPHVSADRHPRRAPLPHAPSAESGPGQEGGRDRQVLPRPLRPVPGEDVQDRRRRWQLAACTTR